MMLFCLFLLLLLIIIVRALMFVPKKENKHNNETITFDDNKAISNLQKLIQCKTVSYKDPSLEDKKEFDKLARLLPKLYPNVYKTVEKIKIEDRAILLHWKGKNNNDPTVFMSHFDVVPVDEEQWSKPAFEGLIKDGVMWGRGTLDTKVTLNGILYAADCLIKEKYVPNNDIYFAFSGKEEIGGPGAKNIVTYFKDNNIIPAMVLDEGGAVLNDVFPGVNKPSAFIGIAEKGCADVKISIKSNGGHAATPNPSFPIEQLISACEQIKKHPFEMKLTPPIEMMLDKIGRESTFLYRVIFSNMWLFKGFFNMYCKKVGGQLNALIRTTTAFTMMKGSKAANVIPSNPYIYANVRIIPGSTVKETIEYIKKIVNNDNIEIVAEEYEEPSVISTIDCIGYRNICDAIEETWDNTITVPYLMTQCSDSKNYGIISNKVYRFSAIDMSDEEMESIHGNDEHIRLETIVKDVEFFIRLMKKC